MKVLILAGGDGTSLFPLSREQHPKQFLRFNAHSLFQMTVKRALEIAPPQDIHVVTSRNQKFMVLDQLSEIGVEAEVIVEPEQRGTLPAVYFGLKEVAPSKVAIFPSDHVVNGEYIEALERAEKLSSDYLVALGVRARKPHPKYGYIKPGEKLNGGYKIDKFVEKPENADELYSMGHIWNTGIYVFDSEIFFEECEKFSPDIAETLENEDYEKVPRASLERCIMEKTDRGAVVLADFFWNDVGCFDAIYELIEKDEHGNAVRGECIGVDSENNIVIGDRLIATIGLRDMVVVDTRDVTLVCPRCEAERVEEIVETLKNRGDERVEFHTTVCRPWGSYTVLEEGPLYKIKHISVKPGKRLSLQMHYHRSEHWVVVRGTAKATVGEKSFLLKSGESTFVPAGMKHRLENPALLPLDVIEVQIGEYLGEDDIVRFDDDFGRS